VRRAIAGAAIASALVACGAGQTRIGSVFSTNWEDDRGASIAKLETKLRNARIPQGASVAVGVVDDGLVGVPLAGGTPWHFTHAIAGRPDIAGAVVVATGASEVFALDAATGRLLWKRSTGGLELIGAGDDGDVTVLTLEGPAGVGANMLAITRDGTVLRQLDPDTRLGRPAVVANVAFIPWQGQYVTAYDVATGEEAARVVLRSATSHAFTQGGALYFGETSVTRFDERIAGASSDAAATARLPARELVGPVRWLSPATDHHPTAAGAGDKVRTYARPAPRGAPMSVADDVYYATYYKVVLGAAAADGALRWVHAHDVDVVGGAAFHGGLAVCDVSGKVTLLSDRTGQPMGEASLGRPVTACVVSADGFARDGGGKPTPLIEQLSAALALSDATLVTVQRTLLAELVRFDDPVVSKILVDLATDARMPQSLLVDVRASLAARRTGAEHLIAALDRRYDFVRDVLRPPPVGPIADALAGMGDAKGAAALARALNDPQTAGDDVKHAAAALVLLATDAEVAPMESFFALYRCTAESDDVVAAVVSIANALVRVQGDRGKITVARAVQDTMTLPAVREKLAAIAHGVEVPNDPAPEAVDPKKKKPTPKKG
jgi:outer membrane protein assembly factor BamB